MRGMLHFIAGSIVGLLCFWVGWAYAHQAIATECKRLGGFFVGDTTFKCHTIEAPKPHQPPLPPPRPPSDRPFADVSEASRAAGATRITRFLHPDGSVMGQDRHAPDPGAASHPPTDRNSP